MRFWVGFAVVVLLSGPLGNEASAQGELRVDRFGIAEVTFEASGEYGNPYTEVRAEASIRRPDGELWQVPLFWDGGQSWKLIPFPARNYRRHRRDVKQHWQCAILDMGR